MIRALQAATGDVVVVATVADDRAATATSSEYAVKMFENHGRGIGEKGKDNGLLILLAVKERRVWSRSRLRPRAVDHRRLRRRDQPRVHGAAVSRAAGTAPGCSPAPNASSAGSRRAATSRSTACAMPARAPANAATRSPIGISSIFWLIIAS